MANFNLFIPKVKNDEGFKSWDEDDSGGLTIWGLIYSSDKNWQGWKSVLPLLNGLSPLAKLEVVFKDSIKRKEFKTSLFNSLEPMKDSLWLQAIPFYKQKYWDKIDGDNIESQELAEQECDEMINAGLGAVNKELKNINNA